MLQLMLLKIGYHHKTHIHYTKMREGNLKEIK